jgi:hypothetical protein
MLRVSILWQEEIMPFLLLEHLHFEIAHIPLRGVWGKSFPPAGSKGRALGRRDKFNGTLL